MGQCGGGQWGDGGASVAANALDITGLTAAAAAAAAQQEGSEAEGQWCDDDTCGGTVVRRSHRQWDSGAMMTQAVGQWCDDDTGGGTVVRR